MDLVLGFPKGWRMVPALHLIVDNHGKPTLLGYSGEWPHVKFFNPTVHYNGCRISPDRSSVLGSIPRVV